MDNSGRWESLFKEVWRRTKEPFSHPSFVFYFVIAILVLGAFGIWNELINIWVGNDSSNSQTLRKTITSFFPILAASTCLQIIWEDRFKSIRSFIIFLFMLTLIGLYIAANQSIMDCIAIKFGVLATAISIWMWWLANADQDFLKDPIDPTAATGNDDTSESLPGDLSGFTH